MTDPIPMPFDGKDIPHIVIEVNQACNLSCKACYKNKYGYTKPMDLILEEIDYAAGQRNLDMITFAGGEPTLHPDLAKAIAHARDKGIKTSILSNGLTLDDARLAEYAAAGLNRVALHVDKLQNRPDAPDAVTEADLHPLREAIFDRVAAHGMLCGVVFTLYQSNLGDLRELVDFVLRNRHVTLMLVTLCTNFKPIAEARGVPGGPDFSEHDHLTDEDVVNTEVRDLMLQEFGELPVHYIASDLREDELRWLFYLGFSITEPDGSYRTLFMSSRFRRTIALANTLQKLTKGRYKFDMVPGPLESTLVCWLYGVFGADPLNWWNSTRFVTRLFKPGSKIHSKVLVFQKPPNMAPNGDIEICKDCPDATVRNGEIVPLCIADIVSPIQVD